MNNFGYPRNLSYIVKRLSGYSKNTFKLQTLNQSSASAGQIITVDLPSNALVDLSSLSWHFKGTTTASAAECTFPRGIETIIERLEIEINGQVIGSGCSYYNQLWSIISDISMGQDVKNRRSVMQNGGGINLGNLMPVTKRPFCIQNWLGFIGSAKPEILDTSILGNVRIRITLASPQILVMANNCTNPSYQLDDMYFSVDTIDLSDGVFHALHAQHLQNGGTYEIPFKNYLSYSSSGSLSQSTKFSLSSQSLNRVWATFVPGSNYILGGQATSHYIDTNSETSPYFTRIGNGGIIRYGTSVNNTSVTYKLDNWQFNVNNVYFPNWRPSAEEAFPLLLNSMNVSQDVLGGCTPGLNSLDRWNDSFWVASQEFEHGSDDYISGIDTRGSTAQCFFETSGSVTPGAKSGDGHGPGGNLTCLVFCETTSVLRVGAGKMLELIS
jgi:hypothetical protein